jgi:transcriptional regulator with XRE-family HTH domain
MSNINDRIKDLVLFFANGNNSLFASKLGISEANVRNYISKTEPKFNILEKIANNFEINFEWLLTGKGEMLKQESEIVNLEKNSFEKLSIEEKLKAIFEKSNELEEQNRKMEQKTKEDLQTIYSIVEKMESKQKAFIKYSMLFLDPEDLEETRKDKKSIKKIDDSI